MTPDPLRPLHLVETSATPADAIELTDSGVTMDDFHAYMPMHTYIYAPTRELWPAGSVNARVRPVQVGVDEKGNPKFLAASAWLDAHRPVRANDMGAGAAELVRDALISDGGWIPRDGTTVFNLYRPPRLDPGDVRKAEPWLAHIRAGDPDDANHIIAWTAHRAQHPGEKESTTRWSSAAAKASARDTCSSRREACRSAPGTSRTCRPRICSSAASTAS